MTRIAAIAFAPMPAHQSPNLTKSQDVVEVYLSASLVAFASFARWNAGWRKCFVTTESLSDKWTRDFASIGVEVVITHFKHSPPEGFAKTFAGSLFSLDALELFAGCEYLLMLDPDALVVNEIPEASMPENAVACLQIPYDLDKNINGLTLRHAIQIFEDLAGEACDPRHYGGEFYGVPGQFLEKLNELISVAWEDSLERFNNKLHYLTTEEHIIGFALSQVPVRESSDVIRRIWTAHSYRTVTGTENLLSVWHLPAEKQRAFRTLFSHAMDPASWFWSSTQIEFLDRCSKICSFRNRSPIRLLMDTAGFLKRKIQGMVRFGRP